MFVIVQIDDRASILKELEVAERAVYFGINGSHEYTHEGFRAAQDNKKYIAALKARLKEFN